MHALVRGSSIRCSVRPTPLLLPLLLAVAISAASLTSQTATAQEPAKARQPAADVPGTTPGATSDATPDAQIVEGELKPMSPAEANEAAWTMLSNAVKVEKRAETRVQALAAVGLLGASPRGLELIRFAMQDHDIDIRIAAVLAAGQTRAPEMTSDLRLLLDDKEPGVAFTAALTLWKMHDHSGEDILMAVADGERGTVSGFVDSTGHTISKQLHNPGGIAKFGAMQGAYMLLGPFGYGLTAYEYLHKNGGDGARVSAFEAIAQNHTAPIHAELIAALIDKDLGVRAAAARALAQYSDADVPPALARVFADVKPPVRFTAAAAYLISTHAAPGATVEGAAPPRGAPQRAVKSRK